MNDVIHSFLKGDYMPHGHCFLWQPGILWTNVLSDLVISLSYFSIPLALFIFVKKRPEIKFRATLLLFAVFILFCGLTHLMSIHNIWHGAYGFQGILKAMTAVISFITAIALFRVLPQALLIPTPDQLTKALHEAADEKFKRSRLELERKAEAIFQFTTELLPTGLLVIDGGQHIRLVNRALEDMFGYKASELIGKHLRCLLADGLAGHHDMLVERYMGNPSQGHAMASGRVVRGKTKEGKEISVEISLSVHSFDGEKHAFASVINVGSVASEKNAFLESSNRLRRAIDATSDGIWEWNVQTDDVWFSPSLMKLIGLANIQSKPNLAHWMEHIHRDDIPRVKAAIQANFEQKEKYDVTYRGRAESGNFEWMQARGDTIFDFDGKPLLMSGVLSNIDENKKLEEALAEKSHFLNAVLDKSLCGMYIRDVASNENTFINRQYTEITGYTLSDLQALSQQGGLMSLYHPDDYPLVRRHIADVINSAAHTGIALQYRFKHKRGDWIWCYSQDSVYSVDKNHKASEVLGTFFEISTLVEREEKIKRLAQDFTTTFEQAAVGIAHVDLDGYFLRVNAKLCKILEYPIEALLSRRFQDITFTEDLEADQLQRHQLIAGKIDSYAMEKRYIRGDGELFWANLTVAIVRTEDGSNSHFISVIQDISERKQIEQALADSNAALERFAYSASHDLQEPLRKISAFSESIDRRLKEKLTEPDARYELSRIGDAARRMREMIDSLLQLSRYSREKANKETISMADILNLVRDDMSALIGSSEASIILDNDFVVWVDKAAFQLVIRNLIANAIRYSQPGQQPVIHLSGKEKGQFQAISVKDHGIGFVAANAEKIFEPFKRLVGKEIEGSGMGLAICRQVMLAHSGSITAKGEPGQGEEFEIMLPIYRG